MPVTKPRGLRLERKKDTSLLNPLKRPYAPKKIRVPLYAGPYGGVISCVKEGDGVRTGQKIADPKGPESVPLFSGVNGTVGKTGSALLPDGRECRTLEILGDGEPGPASPSAEIKKDTAGLSQENLLTIFRDHGLLTLDAVMRPVHERIRRKSAIRTIVINACEPEPYVSVEQFLTGSRTVEVLKGAELLRKACGAEKVVFVTGDATREEFEIIKSKIYLSKWKHYEARMVPSLYPHGLDALLLKEFPGQTLIWNAATAYAAYEAVYFQKPLYERIVTVGGECVAVPHNMWLPFGFSSQAAIQCCKGLLRDPQKIIIGGPMTGAAQSDMETLVTAGTNAILALPPQIAKGSTEQPCVRCNRCVDLCPVSISPAVITIAAENGEYEIAHQWGVEDCVECGVCHYVCPSERPMAELLRLAKEKAGRR